MRSGTRTELKRRWSGKGHRPICKVKIGYEFTYLYAAVNPYDGTLIALLLPYMTKECFKIFMEHFQEQARNLYADEKVLIVLDGAKNHQVSALPNNSSIILQKLPTACPELNPAERFFQQLRTELCNLVFDTIHDVQQHLISILKKYFDSPQLIQSLTLFNYIRH